MYQELTATAGTEHELGDRITGRAALLARRIGAIYHVHGLGRRELLAVHRGIAQLHRVGAAPPANEFWETSALPRAQVLTTVAQETLEGELAALAPLLGRLDPATQPSTEAQLLSALPSGDQLNRLGRWWQRRLRRAATVRALPLLALRTPAQIEREISTTEMMLLDQPPWCHDDRLLSAFELAHGDFVAYGRQRITDMLPSACIHCRPRCSCSATGWHCRSA